MFQGRFGRRHQEGVPQARPQNHPDVTKTKEAEEKSRTSPKYCDVLSKKEDRQKYDAIHRSAWAVPARRRFPAGFDASGFSDIFGSMFAIAGGQWLAHPLLHSGGVLMNINDIFSAVLQVRRPAVWRLAIAVRAMPAAMAARRPRAPENGERTAPKISLTLRQAVKGATVSPVRGRQVVQGPRACGASRTTENQAGRQGQARHQRRQGR